MKAIAALAFAGVFIAHGAVWACSTCSCGDMTLTVMGSEKPYAGRLRAALELRHRSDAVGTAGFNEQRLEEQRLDAQLIWAPLDRLLFMVDVPALRRTVRYVNLARRDTTALGEIELRAKAFVYQDDAFVPAHLVALIGSVKLPTARLQRGADGALLPIELQPGTGSVDPGLGIAYAFFADPWSFYASVTGVYATKGEQGYRASRSLRSTTALQYQLIPSLALRAGIDTRTDTTALEAGSVAADSGGFIGLATAEALFSPFSDWLLYAAVRMPVVNALNGAHDEGAYLSVGLAYDFW
ncbi:MAG: transporter [Myxococcota bacterium]|nr:transporter [Myxococcota bacterium]